MEGEGDLIVGGIGEEGGVLVKGRDVEGGRVLMEGGDVALVERGTCLVDVVKVLVVGGGGGARVDFFEDDKALKAWSSGRARTRGRLKY